MTYNADSPETHSQPGCEESGDCADRLGHRGDEQRRPSLVMADVAQAHEVLLAHVRCGPVVTMPLADALHRTLAQAIACDVDYPPFDRATMDGYAVRSADVAVAPSELAVVGQINAGDVPTDTVGPGTALVINTGAPIPIGADAVARVEITEALLDGERVRINESVPAGKFIGRRAAYVSAGQEVLRLGTLLTPIEIATAASAGASRVRVYKQPTVAVLTTGSELIDIDRVPQGAQIRDANRYALAAMIADAHAEPVMLGSVVDDRDRLRARIEEGLACDILCITGGVSMGTQDFVPAVLAQCGARTHIAKMSIKPGRPTLFASTKTGKLVFGLPGNPVSAFVGFALLVRPALAALQGRVGELPRFAAATLIGQVQATTTRRSFQPVRVEIAESGELTARVLSWRGSGDAFGIATANALLMRPPRENGATTGDRVSVLLLHRL